ncbi:acyl-CoA dehydrogenase family protein [Amnibacterium sp. CER49]|uniref:acyl-CoA dehydrogenase family protein n=1 Tax=Amnibacterium sp. CER49 TaxID=3039161 RepID=UPI002449DA28|nr:acyl-CoA dehydrogenase family protein [Amnibacterium sp. CER49]MDH2442426.1 acyl-CoA dehydrogenase family protein [Amnibacterium sp. CER49]
MTDPADALAAVFDTAALLAPEERAWQQRARDFAAERIRPTIDEDFERARFAAELVPELGAAGFLGMHLAGYGCAGAGPVSYGLVCLELEAVDSAWRTFVSVQGSLAMSAIRKYGSEEQKAALLPDLAAGRRIGCFALTEPQGGSDPGTMRTVARRDGDDWVLTGSKRWIGLASVADVAVVWAATDDGVRGFVVPTATPGFQAVPIRGKLSMRASIQCDVHLDEVRVPADALLPGARGLSGPFGCLNEARFGIVWGVLGAARACIEAALGHATGRVVFGEPIAARQLVQAKLADMLVEYEKGVLLAMHLGRLKERGALPPVQISVGKLNNVRTAIAIAGTARSLLGGDGVTDRFPVMRHLANLESVRTYEGTDEVHQLVIGRALTGISAFS